MNALLVAAALVALATFVVPLADAAPPPPNCIQVYPWSRLCQDPVGAVETIAANPLCNIYTGCYA